MLFIAFGSHTDSNFFFLGWIIVVWQSTCDRMWYRRKAGSFWSATWTITTTSSWASSSQRWTQTFWHSKSWATCLLFNRPRIWSSLSMTWSGSEASSGSKMSLSLQRCAPIGRVFSGLLNATDLSVASCNNTKHPTKNATEKRLIQNIY